MNTQKDEWQYKLWLEWNNWKIGNLDLEVTLTHFLITSYKTSSKIGIEKVHMSLILFVYSLYIPYIRLVSSSKYNLGVWNVNQRWGERL